MRFAPLLVLTLCVVPLPAVAQDAPSLEEGAPDSALNRYRNGRVLYRSGDIEGAAGEFETAFQLFPKSAKLAFNLGRVMERLKRPGPAAKWYRTYLDLAPKAKDRTEVETLISALRRQERAGWVELVVTSDPGGAAVTVDGGAKPTGNTPLKLRLEPGTHALKLALEGHQPVLRSIEVVAGKRNAVVIELQPDAGAAPPSVVAVPPKVEAEADSGPGPDVWPWVVVGTGAATAAVGGVMLVSAESKEAEAADALDGGGSIDDARTLKDDAEGLNTLGWVAVGAGVAIAGGGVAWWLLGSDDATVSVVPLDGGAAAAVHARF